VLRGRGHRGPFLGLDLVPRMVEAARLRHAGDAAAAFRVARVPEAPVDYAFASGIFNVRLDTPEEVWRRYVQATVAEMDACARRGFAFNCLTAYSDPPFMKDHLHYADPLALFDWCKRRFGGRVALLHDYPLYEFTILVPKA